MWIFKGNKVGKSENSEEKSNKNSYGSNFLKLIGLKAAHYIVSRALVMVSKGKKSLKIVVMVDPEVMPEAINILSIALSQDADVESRLYRFKRGDVLRLVPGTSLLGRRIALYCNYPTKESSEFHRNQFTTLKWHSSDGKVLKENPLDFIQVRDLEYYCEIVVNRAGTFNFYFLFEECHEKGPQGSFYVQVEPIIKVGPSGAQKVIPLDSIRCQTVLSKCLGPFSTWENKLRVAKESGYNLIHFTPVQELGDSRSGYSLREQDKVNSEFGNILTTNGFISKDGIASKRSPVTFDDLEKIIKKIRQEWGVASICDIVLNHTANESEWIKEHPEGTYSCFTCPHLRPAYLLDACLAQVGKDVAAGLLDHIGVPVIVETEDHLQSLKYHVLSTYLPKVNIPEFYQCDVEKYSIKFTEEMKKRQSPNKESSYDRSNEIVLIQDPEYRRLGCTINFEVAMEIYNVFRNDCFDEDTRLRRCSESFRGRLEHLNEVMRNEIQEHLIGGIDNCISGTRYERVQADGPNVKEICIKYPLFQKYFTVGKMLGASLKEYEEAMYKENGKYFMAHNGWVINADPLNDFARPQAGTGNVYIRRELIAWGDSCKLRYGDKPEDSPFLWNFMKKYVDTTAKIFDGVRLDNCHSTPLHVAEYLLDSARKINPELYVVAELFTNSDQTDNIFVNRLGITSLIREALSAWDAHEEGRLVYRYGGASVGAFFSSPKRPYAPTIAHALFLDLTHDNPSPVQKRSVFDLLPSAGLVSMACCATGSSRGYDELVPHHIHVVDEERQYQEWGKQVDSESGIIAAKRALNLLHGEMAEQGFSQVFVDQMDPSIVAVTRHSPTSHQSVILVAHTSFSYPDPNHGPTGVRSLRFEGSLDEIILEAGLTHNAGAPFERPFCYKEDEKYINGLTEFKLKFSEHIPLCESNIFKHTSSKDGNVTQLDFENLRPGCVVAVRVSLHDYTKPHFVKLQQLISTFHTESGTKLGELESITSKMNLLDLNRAIFRCDQEEKDMGCGQGVFDIPGYGPLVYAGFQGFNSILTEITPNNDLGHPFCDNLRQGNWMIDYISNRLANNQGTAALSKWLELNLAPLKEIPRYMIPAYFDVIVSGVHSVLKKRVIELMPNFIKTGSNFVQSLALSTLQFVAICESANLPVLSPATKAPKPPQHCATLSAGLPHFSTGYMRCWGRDTFIAIRGIMFLCGRYNEARYMILGFGSTLRHGLIPNLLDSGKPRFNCRDAVWWWLYSIKLYVEEAPNGKEILSDNLSRLFPTDDSETKGPGECDQVLYDVIQEAISVHFQGLIFRERNAGRDIDAHMTENGFNNQIGVHPETGFVFGGNDENCGTWMDKMGSSEKAKNRGVPTSPRDGSAVELIGLQLASLRFMEKMSETKIIPHKSVERVGKSGDKTVWTYKEWADKISKNFEKNFFVSSESGPLANKLSIYKDCVGATKNWTDFQLRCNFPIAMVAAPEMFDPDHAWAALEQAKKYLLGPLGMKTLDPTDWSYRGNYDNSNDSEDDKIAHGANYHQGPEWLWPIGFYLRARLHFAKKKGVLKETIAETWAVLTAHLKEMKTSHWRGLPELTNENGAYCGDSCRTQAWSISTVLEVLYDLKELENVN